jgi:hypothetical protein
MKSRISGLQYRRIDLRSFLGLGASSPVSSAWTVRACRNAAGSPTNPKLVMRCLSDTSASKPLNFTPNHTPHCLVLLHLAALISPRCALQSVRHPPSLQHDPTIFFCSQDTAHAAPKIPRPKTLQTADITPKKNISCVVCLSVFVSRVSGVWITNHVTARACGIVSSTLNAQ